MSGLLGLISFGTSLFEARETSKELRQDRLSSELEAQVEEVGLVQREADRKERLVAALASANASAGARGIRSFEGSNLALINDALRKESVATQRDTFNTDLRVLAMRRGAKLRSDSGKRANLFDTVGSLVSTFGAT